MSKVKIKTYTKSDGTTVTVTVIPTSAIAGTTVESNANVSLGTGRNSTSFDTTNGSGITVNYAQDENGDYTGEPASVDATAGTSIAIGGSSGVGITIGESDNPVGIGLKNGKPSLFKMLGNAVISLFKSVTGLADAAYVPDENDAGATITFSGFSASADENWATVSDNGKNITSINMANVEDGSVTVTGAYDYTLRVHESDDAYFALDEETRMVTDGVSEESFKLSNVTNDSAYTITVLANDELKLDISAVEAKSTAKAVVVSATGGADEIVPPSDYYGVTILGTSYAYNNASGESYFMLTNDVVDGYAIAENGDGIRLATDSTIAVYDADDLDEAIDPNDAFTDVDGGDFVYTKTDDAVGLQYIFTDVGDYITLTEEQAEGFEVFYEKKGVVYDVTEPEIEGGYTLTRYAIDTFVLSDLEADVDVSDSNGATVTFEEEDGTVTFVSTTSTTSAVAGTATFAIAGVTAIEGSIEFDAAAAALLEGGLLINGETVTVDPATTLGVVTYDADNDTFTGIGDGDAATIASDMALAIETDGDDEVTINGVTYSIAGDKDGVTITGGGEVTGLDKDATLSVDEAAELTVNGDKVTVAAGDEIVGYEKRNTNIGAYVVDANHPLITVADDADEVIDKLGINDVAHVIVNEDATTTTYDYTTDEYSDSRVEITLDEDIDSTVVFNDNGKNIAIVDGIENATKNITMGDKGDVVIVTGDTDDKYSQVNITGGDGDDTIVVQGKTPVTFDMSNGGADRIITSAEANAKITLNNYDLASGAGIVVHEPEVSKIATGITEGILQFDSGKVVTVDMDEKSDGTNRLTEITVNDGNADGTLVRLFTYRDTQDSYTDDKGQVVGFTGKSGGTVDASDLDENVILLGNRDGKSSASSLVAGSGDDTIYAGKGDTVDAGEGDNVVNLIGGKGANVVVGEGDTTINGLTTGFDGDVLSLGSNVSINNISFDGTNISIGSAVASVTAADVVNQLFEIDGQTVKAAIAVDGQDITVSGSDVPDYFIGNAGVDFSNYSGDVVVDATGTWKSSSVGGEAATFSDNLVSLKGGSGTNQFMGDESNDYFVAGTGATSLYGGAGNNTLVGASDTTGAAVEFFVLGNKAGAKNTIEGFRAGTDIINTDFASNYISKVDASGDDVVLTVTNRTNESVSETAVIKGAVDSGNIQIGTEGNIVATGQIGTNSVTVDGKANYFAVTESNATVNIGSDVTGKYRVWLDNRGDAEFFAKSGGSYSVINASGSSAELELAGNAAANTITAGSGNASLWGGTGSANDLLVGGTGQNSFYYEQGDGNDTVNNANDGDVVNLFDTSLENITNANITSTGVVLQFNNGGSLTVNSTNAVDYKLADGSTWNANHSTGTWTQKS